MTRPADLSAVQRAVLTVARLHLGLDDDERADLLAVAIPDVDPGERDRRYAAVRAAVGRHEDLCAGILGPAEFLGASELDDDDDDRVAAARVVAWFEVTDALAVNVPSVTVDEHAARAIAIVTDPQPADGQVAA